VNYMEPTSCVNSKHFRRAVGVGLVCIILASACPAQAQNGATVERSEPDQSVIDLAKEVRGKGWIIYSAPSGAGDWDLFVMRPDGSDRSNITRTRDFSEVAGRFSPDGAKLLYYRMARAEVLDNNKYGTHELVISRADGTDPAAFGEAFSWASWSPDGAQVACLSREGIRFIDLATRGVVRKLDRKGFVEQLFWSPDGKWLVGTANGLGEQWAIGRMDAVTGELNRVSDGNCFNCTPDWFPDSKRVVYSKGHPLTAGWAQLWTAEASGERRRMLYGEIGRHIYGGAISPDGHDVLFTRSREDLGKVDNSYTEMALIRLEDTPIVGGKSEVLHEQYPRAKNGPMLELSWGWEPHWTEAKLNFPK
jgi:WD40-like Beta Propeller Repeat